MCIFLSVGVFKSETDFCVLVLLSHSNVLALSVRSLTWRNVHVLVQMAKTIENCVMSAA